MVKIYKYLPLIFYANYNKEIALIAGAYYYLLRNANLAQQPLQPYIVLYLSHY